MIKKSFLLASFVMVLMQSFVKSFRLGAAPRMVYQASRMMMSNADISYKVGFMFPGQGGMIFDELFPERLF